MAVLTSSFRSLQIWYMVIVINAICALGLLTGSHITRSLVLLSASYHSICTLIFLTGNIVFIKKTSPSITSTPADELKALSSKESVSEQMPSETKLRNTFGWVRIDILVLLVGSVLLISFSFSVLVTALQNLIHIGHEGGLVHPLIALHFGVGGIVINVMTYGILGGIYFSQKDLLTVSNKGEVYVNSSDLSLSKTSQQQSSVSKRVALKAARDNSGYIFVIITAVGAYITGEDTAKYIDLSLAIVSNLFVLLLYMPVLKTSIYILIQTIPNGVRIDALTKDLLSIPDIVNIHDFHIWRLTEDRSVASVHIIFRSKEQYLKVNSQIIKVFHEKDITNVTIQPEFSDSISTADKKSIPAWGVEFCQFRCKGKDCNYAVCCSVPECQLKTLITTPSDAKGQEEKSESAQKDPAH